MARTFVIIICMSAMALTMGCIGETVSPAREKRYFLLQVEPGPQVSSTAEKRVLAVRRFHVSPGFATKEMVYKVGEHAFRSDYYNLFLVSPGDMLTEAARSRLRDSGLFEHVVSTTTDARMDYILEGALTVLYGDFSRKDEALAVIEAQFFLLLDDPGVENVLAEYAYARSTSFEDRNAQGLVAAYNECLTDIFNELEAELARDLPSLEPPSKR